MSVPSTLLTLLWSANALFMLGVGAMKASGSLRHHLSPLCGLLELLGALSLLLSATRGFGGAASPSNFAGLGYGLCLAGLGVIISTPKRNSVVCWAVAAANVFLS
eukprot:CAMPEP_0182466886 /NCGR_PEP_ID=MMETSP1319-20130603/12833_1 /TAXON_ID=172717 /ORGANISM="Bolidomonas pacifica, Strain RCC208" /LENGTH=104 /DNA_ID=CAMNT_0024666927 /DNA_START=19 /DNA_END=329 /DNA_ORIENTATION=+